MNKKGIFVPMLTVMTLLIMIYAFYTFATMEERTFSKTVGGAAVSVLGKYSDTEKALFYLDQSARYSGYKSLIKLGENGGFSGDSECGGIDGYNLWLEVSKECYPDFESNFKKVFDEIFKDYLSRVSLLVSFEGYNYILELNEEHFFVIGEASDGINIIEKLSWVEVVEEDKSDIQNIVEGDKSDIQKIIGEASSEFSLNINLISAIIKAESDFNPESKSEKDARGLMQLTDITIEDINGGASNEKECKGVRVEDVYDVKQNIFGGSCYFAYLLRVYNGDKKIALAAYNWGPTNINNKCNKNLPCLFLPKETSQYVDKVLAYESDFSEGSINIPTTSAIVDLEEQGFKIEYSIAPNFKQKINYNFKNFNMVLEEIKTNLDCFKESSELEVNMCIKGSSFDYKIKKGGDLVKFDVVTGKDLFNNEILLKFAIEFNNL